MRKALKKWICAASLASLVLTAGCAAEAGPPLQPADDGYCVQFNDAVSERNPIKAALPVLINSAGQISNRAFSDMALRYEMLLDENRSKMSDRVFSGTGHRLLYEFFPQRFDPAGICDIYDMPYRQLLEGMVKGGFTLIKSDKGLYEVHVDYGFFKAFGPHLDEETRFYFELMDEEQKAPIAWGEKDAEGIIQLQERLERLNGYVNAYPKSPRLKAISEKANRYLLMIVFGGEANEVYDENDMIRPQYLDSYRYYAKSPEKSTMHGFMAGLVRALEASEGQWTGDVFDYVIGHPEIFRKRYLNSDVYPDAFVDVGFGWTSEEHLYYFPVFTGINSLSEQGKLNMMGRAVPEKRMLGQGFKGMYTGGSYIWSDFDLTFNRQDWISLKMEIYSNDSEHEGQWTYEGLNYDLKEKRPLHLNDILADQSERRVINRFVENFFEKSRTYYVISLEDFYKNPDPEFYLTDDGIVLLVPVEINVETMERVVEIFIPFKKFRTNVEYIYKIPEGNFWCDEVDNGYTR